MIEEAYVSFEVAKLLKEKGFDEDCRYFYDCATPNTGYLSNKRYGEYIHNSKVVYDGRNLAACPTHQMAMAWLRQTHKINIVIMPAVTDDDGDGGCLYKYIIFKTTEVIHKSECLYEKYDVACDNSLKYALENLI